MHSLSILKYHTGRVDSTVLSTSVQQHLYAESHCPQFIMITFLIRIMDTDWEVLKVQIKVTCLESCTSSWNIKLLILTLQLYDDFGKPWKLWQNKLAKPLCWIQSIVLQLAYRAKQCLNIQTIWRTRLYCQLQFSTQAQVVRSDTAIIQGNANKKISITIFSIILHTKAVCTEKIYHNVNCFLLSGRLSHGDMCSPPVLPYRY